MISWGRQMPKMNCRATFIVGYIMAAFGSSEYGQGRPGDIIRFNESASADQLVAWPEVKTLVKSARAHLTFEGGA